MDSMNAATDDIYDARLSWEDIELFMAGVRKFYSNNVPDTDEWDAMKQDVKKAYTLLADHWDDENVSYRYDFLTLVRVMKHYLPEPSIPRPTGEDWYYQIKNS